jgi:hypothetical protein
MSGRDLVEQHSADSKLSRAEAAVAAGGQFPAREDFLGWAESQLPSHARVFLACGRGCGPREWITYRLSPRVFVERPRQAGWLLFYDEAPTPALSGLIGRRREFQPRFLVAQVRP